MTKDTAKQAIGKLRAMELSLSPLLIPKILRFGDYQNRGTSRYRTFNHFGERWHGARSLGEHLRTLSRNVAWQVDLRHSLRHELGDRVAGCDASFVVGRVFEHRDHAGSFL